MKFQQIASGYKARLYNSNYKGTGSVIDFTLNNKNVLYAPEIQIFLITKRD